MAIYLLQMIGIAACAVSGALAAGRKGLDLIGVIVISFAAAVGGGTLRDLLLGRSIFWLADNAYLFVSIACAILTWLYALRWAPPVRLLLLTDAIGLAVFTITGVQIAQNVGQGPVVCLVMGVITGTAGGAVRDLLSGEIPLVFRQSELYASAAFLGAVLYLILLHFGIRLDLAALAGSLLIFLLRLAALKWKWKLPVFNFREKSDR